MCFRDVESLRNASCASEGVANWRLANAIPERHIFLPRHRFDRYRHSNRVTLLACGSALALQDEDILLHTVGIGIPLRHALDGQRRMQRQAVDEHSDVL